MKKLNEIIKHHCDVNGNTCDCTSDSAYRPARSDRDRSPSNSLEDWQLIDDNPIVKPEASKREDHTARSYTEIDPLDGEHLSPSMVYLCTAIYSIVPLTAALSALLLIWLLFTRFYFVTLAYWLLLFLDKSTYNTGGRRLNFVHQSRFWVHLAAYFSVKLRYTNKFSLSPERNYILSYHPHGIAAMGAVTAFATNGLKLNKIFPAIRARFMVHETSFIMPVMKEVFGLRGDCSVNSKSIDHMLTRCGTGNLLTVVVGGLAEADLSDANILKLVVAKRKGFIKKALIHGADIIPCIAFGENSIFNKVDLTKQPKLHRLETGWYQLFKFKHPIYYGRSFFSKQMPGLMPFQKPITVVMGDPIRVTKNTEPSQSDIDSLHAEYLEQVSSVYRDNSDLCNTYDRKLEIL